MTYLVHIPGIQALWSCSFAYIQAVAFIENLQSFGVQSLWYAAFESWVDQVLCAYPAPPAVLAQDEGCR